MLRLGGAGTQELLRTPHEFGESAQKLFSLFDAKARELSRHALQSLPGGQADKVDAVLDPLIGPNRELVPNYISSSILDSFFYAGRNEERHVNNHAAHTDSGLLTMVVCTDNPGLEIYDTKLEQWIAVEEMIHEHVASNGSGAEEQAHRQFAVAFFSDSVVYIDAKKRLKPVLHRVAGATEERISVVFKQRALPRVSMRYQEDYVLCDLQDKALQAAGMSGSTLFTDNAQLIAAGSAIAIAAALVIVVFRMKRN